MKKSEILVLGILSILMVVAISGCTSDTGNTSSTPSTTASNNTINSTSNVLLEKGNVKMTDGDIYVDNQLVGTYKIVTKPPAESADVEYRTWNGKRTEVVDFSGTGKYMDYYTQYNRQWVKMSIDTTLSSTALEITNDIYTVMG